MNLTKAQRRLLFTVGAFGSGLYYGAWGAAAQARVRSKLRYTLELIDFDFQASKYILTKEGRKLFDKLFGAACAQHGWTIIKDSSDSVCGVCPHCREVFKRIEGYDAPPARN